jgi:hypothetical protein
MYYDDDAPFYNDADIEQAEFEDAATQIERERIAWGTGNEIRHGDYLTAHATSPYDY